MDSAVQVGQLVVVPSRRALGVGRLERVLDADGETVPRARLFLYDDGTFVTVALSDVEPCPAGVWDRGPR